MGECLPHERVVERRLVHVEGKVEERKLGNGPVVLAQLALAAEDAGELDGGHEGDVDLVVLEAGRE